MTQEEAAILARLEEDNRRLRALLEVKDAPSELRHRLRNTMSLLRSIIRKSAETGRELEAFVAHFEDRMDAIARAQVSADARGSIDLHGMVADELLRYGAKEGQKLQLSGPSVSFEPRAGQLMTLAIHELAVNAIEHGCLVSLRSRVKVEWRCEADKADRPFILIWKETGNEGPSRLSREGFGTELLTRTLQYELAAEAEFELEADGLRYIVRFPLSDRVGQVYPSSEAQNS